MTFIIIIFTILFVVAILHESSKKQSFNSPPNNSATSQSFDSKYTENCSDNVIKIIELLTECIASHDDASFYVVFENDARDGDNKRIIIHGCIDGWANSFLSKTGAERWRWLSTDDAAFLDSVPFTFEGDNVTYTYFTKTHSPIYYKNSCVSAVMHGIAIARFARHDRIKIEESQSSISFYCN